MDPRHPTPDPCSSRFERLPRVVDWVKASDLHVDGCAYVDLDGYNAQVARWSLRASVLTFVIGLFGSLAVLQEDLAVRVAFGSVTACIIVARVAVAGRRPDIDNYVRRDP